MRRIREFQRINPKDKSIHLPQRSTSGSAGYDIRASRTVIVPSFIRRAWSAGNSLDTYYYKYIKPVEGYSDTKQMKRFRKVFECMTKDTDSSIKLVSVPTGIKARFPKDEVLYIYNRSSNPVKRGLVLANGVGVIDSDYYNNPANQGELIAQFYNLSAKDYIIHKGDRIVQGVFAPYLLTDNDQPRKQPRRGGFGSTSVK